MRAMRDINDGRDDSLIVFKTVTCEKRRNKPRLDYRICESGCNFMTDCDNYREWYRKNFKKDLATPKTKRARKNKTLTREEVQKREEQVAGKTEAYNILLQTMVTKPKVRKPRSKNKAAS